MPKPGGKQKKKESLKERIVRRWDLLSTGIGPERSLLMENLSMLVAGGMTVSAAIRAVGLDARSPNLKRILVRVMADLEDGVPLWQAFKKSSLFPDQVISFLRIGEESGRLTENLALIAIQREKEKNFKSKIRSAMMYPVFVLTLTVSVGTAIAWFILPRLASIFSQLKLDLPLVTRILIAGGTFLGEYGSIVFPSLFGGFVLVMYFTFYFSKTKFIGQAILLAIPGVGRLLREVELSRFCYMLATLLEASLPATEALDSLQRAAVLSGYKKFYAYLYEQIDQGNSFQKSFAGYKRAKHLIPVPVQQLIIAGEQSGNLAGVLFKISERYEAKTDLTTKNLTVILEPLLLVIVWLGVVAVALAVILPIYSLIGGLNVTSGPQTGTTSTRSSTPASTTPAETSTNPSEDGTGSTDTVPPDATASDQAATDATIIDTTTTDATPPQEEPVVLLQILDTPVGYLNVRDDPTTGGDLIGQVKPGEIYQYLDEENGWYNIDLGAGESGWVIGDYVSLLNDLPGGN